MHIHILGICGTFMGGIALLAKQAGFRVTGSDQNVYPPMSTTLEKAGITLIEGFEAQQLDIRPDLIVVGNVMKRGMPVIERMLNEGFDYVSGPQWLEEHYLKHKTVLAVAGTHGKTTTSSMLAWILNCAGLNPGFLIGGMPGNYTVSAQNTASDYFVIEADEYDCAFFDKRSKFIHYHPQVLILNNLEYDHADIFEDLNAIKKQFHQLIRTMPSRAQIIVDEQDINLKSVLQMGCWSKICPLSEVSYQLDKADGSQFSLVRQDLKIRLNTTGSYNVHNALMAMMAAQCVGVDLVTSAKALGQFVLPKRRLQLRGSVREVEVYDDFAHHPTAIRLTLEGMRAHIGTQRRLIAVFEPRSNSMRLGANRESLAASFACADQSFVYATADLKWDAQALVSQALTPLEVIADFEQLLESIVAQCQGATTVVIMSNGSFNGIHERLLQRLKASSE